MPEKRFEYISTHWSTSIVEMNKLGAEGWEFISFSVPPIVPTEMIWKRELPKKIMIIDTNKTPWEEKDPFAGVDAE